MAATDGWAFHLRVMHYYLRYFIVVTTATELTLIAIHISRVYFLV
jgi:hypothetical protein